MREKGQALVEMALILPLLLILVVGIVEGGIVLSRQLVVVNAAREGARFGAYGAEADAIYAQTLLATSQMFEFTEENAVVAVIHAETNEDGTGFIEWITNTYPADAAVPHVTQGEVLEQLNEEGNDGNLKMVIVDVRYDHQSLLGFPFVGALADQVSIGSWTVMRVFAPKVDKGLGCCALPITFPVEDLKGLSIGAELVDVHIGSNLGTFSWLFWRYEPGAVSKPILERNLADRCQVRNFQDACDGSAELTSSSWVWGGPGNVVAAQNEVKKLKGGYYPVPVWDEFKPCGAGCGYCKPGTQNAHIVAFALMEITEVNLDSSPKTISAKFRGWYGGCDE